MISDRRAPHLLRSLAGSLTCYRPGRIPMYSKQASVVHLRHPAVTYKVGDKSFSLFIFPAIGYLP